MTIHRRDLLRTMGGLAVTAAIGARPAAGSTTGDARSRGPLRSPLSFPRSEDFDIPDDVTFLNAAYTHPLPVAGADALEAWARDRARPGPTMVGSGPIVRQVKEDFATLIGARANEIGFIPNTSTGENLVLNGLGIPERAGSGINVVTDALHFEGALVHLQALERERGLEVRVAMPRNHGIDPDDIERLVDRNTVLVEVSLVAMYNGFQHDLKTICDIAHARGACVYADIIQGVGAVPIDVRDSGVDFCASSSFKWLMGDFGIGFLYAREDLLGDVVRRTQWGYHSVDTMATHFLPHDPPGEPFFEWTPGSSASAHFEVGSNANGALRTLAVSLPYLLELGVENIEAHRQPLLDRLRDEMPRLGFDPVTPPGTRAPIITFAMRPGHDVAERLERARVNARVAPNYIRLSPSVYNDMDDIERLLEALA